MYKAAYRRPGNHELVLCHVLKATPDSQLNVLGTYEIRFDFCQLPYESSNLTICSSYGSPNIILN